MDRKSFLFSIPLIGLVAKAIAKPEEPKIDFSNRWPQEAYRKYPLTEREAFKVSEDGYVMVWDQDKQGFKELKAEISGRTVTVVFKKDDDGKFSVTDPNNGRTVKGNLLWTDEAEIKLV